MLSLTFFKIFHPNTSGWPWHLGSGEVITKRASPAVFEIIGPRHIDAMIVTFLGHVTSSVTWPIDSPSAISCWCPLGTESLSSTVFEIFGPKTHAHTHRHTHRHTPQVISYSVPCNVLHWTDISLITMFTSNRFTTFSLDYIDYRTIIW